MRLRVLTWNLMHGRAVPGAGRDLLTEFGDALASWEWEIALLQEVPPWWPGPLGARLSASARLVLTSRNSLLAARRAIAVRWPDLIKSNGGGCNAILVRGGLTIAAHRLRRLSWLPERRWMHAVRLSPELWVANLHAGGRIAEARRAAQTARAWAGAAPLVLGGDFNVHQLVLDGLASAGGHAADHVFVRGLEVLEPAKLLRHDPLSDHAPLLVTVGS